jgi:hypothetical protein
MIVKDAELDKMFVYFLVAYYFHWTPEEVDRTDAYTLDCMLTMLPEWKAKVQDSMENG